MTSLKHNWAIWIPVILWAALIFYLSSYPSPVQSPIVTTLEKALSGSNSAQFSNLHLALINFDKWVNSSETNRRLFHFLTFFILGILGQRAMFQTVPKHLLWWTWVGCIAYAFSDEIHQIYVPGRTFQWLDIVTDAFGAAIGIGLIWLMQPRKLNKHN